MLFCRKLCTRKIKRKDVPNKSANDIPIEVSQSLGFRGLYSNEVSSSTSDDHLGISHVVDHGTIPFSCVTISTGLRSNLASFPGFCDTVTTLSSRDESAMEIGEGIGGYGIANGP